MTGIKQDIRTIKNKITNTEKILHNQCIHNLISVSENITNLQTESETVKNNDLELAVLKIFGPKPSGNQHIQQNSQLNTNENIRSQNSSIPAKTSNILASSERPPCSLIDVRAGIGCEDTSTKKRKSKKRKRPPKIDIRSGAEDESIDYTQEEMEETVTTVGEINYDATRNSDFEEIYGDN